MNTFKDAKRPMSAVSHLSSKRATEQMVGLSENVYIAI